MAKKKKPSDKVTVTLGCKDCDEKGCDKCNYTGQIPFNKKNVRKMAMEVIKTVTGQKTNGETKKT